MTRMNTGADIPDADGHGVNHCGVLVQDPAVPPEHNGRQLNDPVLIAQP